MKTELERLPNGWSLKEGWIQKESGGIQEARVWEGLHLQTHFSCQ